MVFVKRTVPNEESYIYPQVPSASQHSFDVIPFVISIIFSSMKSMR